MPNVTPSHQATMGRGDYLTGGEQVNGSSARTSIPLINGNWIRPNAAVLNNTARVSIPFNQIAAVDEGVNGCAPSAVARSIKYLRGTNVPASQSIYNDLVTAMGTVIGPGGGTNPANELPGKNTWVAGHGGQISSGWVAWGGV